ncbi:toxin-antitoxin system YwqK family antitoxin [Aureibacter tunicatorum]|uniref:Antitoxin component YwqK of YwqJK toxin-antitoxin module n=1 Tax=Aureibacter tunicatorum TaxID=866807 RepID=A0AAE3XJD5_9BACT|nr:hypothetical protein [Aureibacter tunicatorum]MDR6237030.1 antitoxin component YwqK of YwqJK toxin-antitoxin module [Aureibacter tunicatorum]BDD06022.1 hypothetical protein AUTU_35050 [Aureibacter tunicatorum]
MSLNIAQGQTDSNKFDGLSLENYSPVTLDIQEVEEPEEEDGKKKKKKVKKNFYYGKKTRKGYTQKGYGDKVEIEFLSMLKEPYDTLDAFVRDIYWYDYQERKVRKSRNFDSSKGALLHGPYKRMKGDEVLEEGIFYFGMKHGRWTRFDGKGILLDKQKYYKGWPKESKVSYYVDEEGQKKIKAVLPVEYGEVEGNFYMFFESGKVAVKGEYQQGKKVGKWYEYYGKTGKVKRLIQYPIKWYDYDEGDKGFIAKEWSMRGKVLYKSDKELPKRKRRR